VPSHLAGAEVVGNEAGVVGERCARCKHGKLSIPSLLTIKAFNFKVFPPEIHMDAGLAGTRHTKRW